MCTKILSLIGIEIEQNGLTKIVCRCSATLEGSLQTLWLWGAAVLLSWYNCPRWKSCSMNRCLLNQQLAEWIWLRQRLLKSSNFPTVNGFINSWFFFVFGHSFPATVQAVIQAHQSQLEASLRNNSQELLDEVHFKVLSFRSIEREFWPFF